eukprot:gene4995-3590_t
MCMNDLFPCCSLYIYMIPPFPLYHTPLPTLTASMQVGDDPQNFTVQKVLPLVLPLAPCRGGSTGWSASQKTQTHKQQQKKQQQQNKSKNDPQTLRVRAVQISPPPAPSPCIRFGLPGPDVETRTTTFSSNIFSLVCLPVSMNGANPSQPAQRLDEITCDVHELLADEVLAPVTSAAAFLALEDAGLDLSRWPPHTAALLLHRALAPVATPTPTVAARGSNPLEEAQALCRAVLAHQVDPGVAPHSSNSAPPLLAAALMPAVVAHYDAIQQQQPSHETDMRELEATIERRLASSLQTLLAAAAFEPEKKRYRPDATDVNPTTHKMHLNYFRKGNEEQCAVVLTSPYRTYLTHPLTSFSPSSSSFQSFANELRQPAHTMEQNAAPTPVEVSTSRSTNSPSSSSSSRGSSVEPSSTSSTDASSTSSTDASSTSSTEKRTPARAALDRPPTRNPQLRFTRPDNEYIPVPAMRDAKQMSRVLQTLLEDTLQYPLGQYRMIDYCRTAVHMFVMEVRREYAQQHKMALRNGKAISRFVWKNKGELAVCFACVCDMMKLLFDKIRPGPRKPLWDDFIAQMAPMLMTQSRIPPAVLSSNTYHTKFMDWQKGGTRYAGESFKTNVRFPSAADRQIKVEMFLKSGAGYQIQTIAVDPSTAAPAPAKAPPPTATPTPPPHHPGVQVPGVLPVKRSAGPLRLPPQHAGSSAINAAAAAPKIPEEIRHLFWLATLTRVKGGEPEAAFPDERAPLMTAFGRLCDMSKTPEEMLVLVRVIRHSSAGIQTIFERLGGLISFRMFASFFIEREKCAELMLLVDTVARLRTPSWGLRSQASWCTDMKKSRGLDLQWLRHLPLIPSSKRPAWGALLIMMEEKFIFSPSTETLETRKQSETERPDIAGLSLSSSSVLRAAAADVHGMSGWKWPRLQTFNARRLPDEWRAPLFLTEDEDAELQAYIEAKQRFLDEEQERWRKEVLKMVAAQEERGAARDTAVGSSLDDVPIPLWYDPLQVLGIEPPLKATFASPRQGSQHKIYLTFSTNNNKKNATNHADVAIMPVQTSVRTQSGLHLRLSLSISTLLLCVSSLVVLSAVRRGSFTMNSYHTCDCGFARCCVQMRGVNASI